MKLEETLLEEVSMLSTATKEVCSLQLLVHAPFSPVSFVFMSHGLSLTAGSLQITPFPHLFRLLNQSHMNAGVSNAISTLQCEME